MPHHRTRAMLVARGVQPEGPDRRLPPRPILPAPVEAPVVNTRIQVAPSVNVDVNVDANVDVDADDVNRPHSPL